MESGPFVHIRFNSGHLHVHCRFVLIGFFCFYQGIVNTIRSLSDKPVHYALSIPFVK